MNFERLEKNITDNIKEAQLKIGFDNKPVSFNYMLSSLSHLLGEKLDFEQAEEILKDFSEYFCDHLGGISSERIKNGFCITVPEKGGAYVNGLDGYDFITEFVEAVRRHGTTIPEILDIFRKYGEITVKKVKSEEFDCLVFFNDGKPEEYFYCLADEGGHVSYHRFIKEDYFDFGFQEDSE